jgi:type IV pilus assembly protein PilE
MKKLLKRFKKWFGTSKGFTLIELLVVIAILGVLLVGSIVAINPVQKINQAKDATAKAGVDQLASAMSSYYTQNQTYPASIATIVGLTGELRSEPKNNAGASFTYDKVASGCAGTIASACTGVAVSFTLLVNDTTSSGCTSGGSPCTLWCWLSSAGKAGPATACTATP